MWEVVCESDGGRVSWMGYWAQVGDASCCFLKESWVTLLYDTEGKVVLTEYLHGFSLTGMGRGASETGLVTGIPKYCINDILVEGRFYIQSQVNIRKEWIIMGRAR